MNQNNGRALAVDAALEQFSRDAVPAEVERRLETRLREFCRNPTPLELAVATPQQRISRPLVRTSVAAGVAALVAVGLFVVFANQDAWAQVTKAMRSKPWVRWKLQIPTGEPVPAGFQVPEFWFSAQKKVFAGSAGHSVHYTDLAGQETYDYFPQTKTLTRSLTSDIENVEVGHFETLLRLVSDGDRTLKLPESPIQIVERVRRDVPEGNRRWTEYTFACRDSRRTPPDYRVTFRVDPVTQLPMEMRSTEKFASNDPADERTYAIDYPEAGPSDIYALGVPRSAVIVDRRRAVTRTADEVKEFLAAYVEARKKPLEPYTTIILTSVPNKEFSDIYRAWRGKCDGAETQVEEADPLELTTFREKLWSGKISRPLDVDQMEWWKQQLAGMKFQPLPRGDEMLPDRIGYPHEFLTFGASPVDHPDCQVTLDRKPTSGPPETVLLKIRTETTLGFNDCFYWIAPERDYLVLRHEIHFSKDHAAWNNSTQIIDKVEQSPSGRWYATAVRMGRVESHGDDLSAEPVLVNPRQPPQTGMEMGPVTTTSLRYLVEFK